MRNQREHSSPDLEILFVEQPCHICLAAVKTREPYAGAGQGELSEDGIFIFL